MNKNNLLSEEDEDKIVQFPRKATDTLPPDWEDWLSKLPVGTHFLCQRTNTYSRLDEYIIRSKSTSAVYLEFKEEDFSQHYFVDPKLFSLENKLFEIIQILE